jgi:alkaline phosphatase isozyme conversion protein
MSAEEKKNTLLVINLDNLIVGDKLYFNSGQSTPGSVRKLTRDRALAIARSQGFMPPAIRAATRIIREEQAAVTTVKCSIKRAFRCCTWKRRTGRWAKRWLSAAGKSKAFPDGTSWHDVMLDNQQHIDSALPQRIEHRSRDVVKVMLPLVKELAKAGKA